MIPILQRLRERKLFQWALAYLAGAWVLFQGIEVMAEPWALTPGFQRTVHLLVGLGFLVTLVLAWYHGEKGRQRVGAVELLIIALLLAVGAVLIQMYRPTGEGASEDRQAERAERAEDGQIRSLAVLPFANLMGDPDQAYFVDGLHDILIGELAGISELTVISRTSVLRYRDSDRALGEIATELGVDALVEGSVFRAGDSLRVSVQLMRASPEEHLWQDRYEGRLSDAFNLQIQVAQAVAREIRSALSPREAERLARRTVIDPAAQEAYLRGRALWRTRAADGIRRSLAYLEQAVAIDSTFALAWSGLADAYTMGSFYGGLDVSLEETFARAERYATRALALDPDLAEAHAALAGARFWGGWDAHGAERHLRQALSLNPNLAQAHNWLGDVLGMRGDVQAAVESFQRARDLDPFSPLMNRDLARGLMHVLRYDEAIVTLRTAIALDPDHAEAYETLRHSFRAVGRMDEAAEAAVTYMQTLGFVDAAESLRAAYNTRGWEGLVEAEIRILLSMSRNVQAAYRCMELNRQDEAFEVLFAAVEAHEGRVVTLRAVPFFAPLHSDPRWDEVLRRAGI